MGPGGCRGPLPLGGSSREQYWLPYSVLLPILAHSVLTTPQRKPTSYPCFMDEELKDKEVRYVAKGHRAVK